MHNLQPYLLKLNCFSQIVVGHILKVVHFGMMFEILTQSLKYTIENNENSNITLLQMSKKKKKKKIRRAQLAIF